ncbi:MAG: TolC family protein, partial [Spirulina sp. DLM2.Bin59]
RPNTRTDQPTTIPPSREGVPLTLDEAVALAVLHNTEVRNRYLDRIVERASLRTAAHELLPQLTPRLITGLVDQGGSQGTNAAVSAQLSWLVPTGGKLEVDWRSQLNSFRNDDASQGLMITYRHPLNRYGESAIAYRNRERSLIQEDINLLDLRRTLNSTITQTIQRYRELILAQEQVTLTQASLDNARRDLQRQRALVEAGRQARSSLLRIEQNVASFQSQLLGAENAVQSARLALMNQVGIDRNLPVVAIAVGEAIDTEPVQLDPQALIAVSLAQRPDYLTSLLSLNLASLDLQEADHKRRWQLDLETRYADATAQRSDFSVQLVLTHPLGERTRHQEAFERSRIARLQRENNLAQQEADIRIAIQNQVRQVRLQFEQLQIARQRVNLATQELAAQEALIQAGRGNPFELQDAQRELLTVRTDELTQRINYLNALTALDEIQGITLERWGIQLDPAR